MTIRLILLSNPYMTKLCLHTDSQRMTDAYHFLNLPDILLKGQKGAVNHDGGVACTDTEQTILKALSVIQIQCNLYTGTSGKICCQMSKAHQIRIRNRCRIQDNTGIHFFRGLDCGAQIMLIINVAGRYRIIFLLCLC